jgi:glutamate dehydrogenase
MTDDVAELTLDDNRDQNVVLGVARAHAAPMANVHARLITELEARNQLERELDVLPSAAEFAELERAGTGCRARSWPPCSRTRSSTSPPRCSPPTCPMPRVRRRLPEYFPAAVRDRFPGGPQPPAAPGDRHHDARQRDGRRRRHHLRLPAGGGALGGAADAVRAYTVATVVFDLPALWERMRDPAIPTAVSDAILLESRRVLDRVSRWLLTNRPQPLTVGSALARFSEPIRALMPRLPELLQGRERRRCWSTRRS